MKASFTKSFASRMLRFWEKKGWKESETKSENAQQFIRSWSVRWGLLNRCIAIYIRKMHSSHVFMWDWVYVTQYDCTYTFSHGNNGLNSFSVECGDSHESDVRYVYRPFDWYERSIRLWSQSSDWGRIYTIYRIYLDAIICFREQWTVNRTPTSYSHLIWYAILVLLWIFNWIFSLLIFSKLQLFACQMKRRMDK